MADKDKIMRDSSASPDTWTKGQLFVALKDVPDEALVIIVGAGSAWPIGVDKIERYDETAVVLVGWALND